MKEFTTNDQEDYYSGITCITVNGKNAYELKGKFLDDLHNNAFDGTNGKDAVKHIEYFLRIVDPIDLPNVNHDKFRVVVFPISLVGGARRWFDKIKESIDRWDYWKMGSDEIEPTDDESSDLEETDHDDEQEIGEIFRIETNLFNYETPLCKEFKEFNYLLKIDPDLLTKYIKGFKTYEEFKDVWIYEWNEDIPWRNDGLCNGGNLPGAYIVGNTLHYQDLEWYDALKDDEMKEEALRNKAIMEGLIDKDDESSNNGWRRWDDYEITNHDQEEREYKNELNNEEICESFNDHESPVCTIRRFKMIKYSFGQDEEYVAIKEDKYEDLTITSKDACRAYQEIFRMMDEGWMATRDGMVKRS
ncbi:hypothetical protein Tco_0651934 [Tanacetum coccineum]|uniref:Retrotransposon gag domain-containing protein n=1 Tax=Tanacetum coccineum TaxID=301880 RepID=A0ABQ4WWD3_9ASTR